MANTVLSSQGVHGPNQPGFPHGIRRGRIILQASAKVQMLQGMLWGATKTYIKEAGPGFGGGNGG